MNRIGYLPKDAEDKRVFSKASNKAGVSATLLDDPVVWVRVGDD
jgi:hypothetical protein